MGKSIRDHYTPSHTMQDGVRVRVRDCIGEALDMERLLVAGRDAALAQGWPVEDVQKITHGPAPMGLYEHRMTGWVLVNNEGVGTCSQHSDGTIEVYFSIGYMWIPIPIRIEDVLDAIEYKDGEPVKINLADQIRTFGDRLETNFSINRDTIKRS